MLSHHAMDLTCFSPTLPDPRFLVISSSGLSWSDCHTAVYSTLLSHTAPPVYTACPPGPALHRPPPPHPTFRGSSSRSSENRLICRLPPSVFPSSSSYSLGVQLCCLCGGPFSPIYLYLLVPLSQSQGAVSRTQKEGERCVLALPPCSSRECLCPLSSHVLNNNAK